MIDYDDLLEDSSSKESIQATETSPTSQGPNLYAANLISELELINFPLSKNIKIEHDDPSLSDRWAHKSKYFTKKVLEILCLKVELFEENNNKYLRILEKCVEDPERFANKLETVCRKLIDSGKIPFDTYDDKEGEPSVNAYVKKNELPNKSSEEDELVVSDISSNSSAVENKYADITVSDYLEDMDNKTAPTDSSSVQSIEDICRSMNLGMSDPIEIDISDLDPKYKNKIETITTLKRRMKVFSSLNQFASYFMYYLSNIGFRGDVFPALDFIMLILIYIFDYPETKYRSFNFFNMKNINELLDACTNSVITMPFMTEADSYSLSRIINDAPFIARKKMALSFSMKDKTHVIPADAEVNIYMLRKIKKLLSIFDSLETLLTRFSSYTQDKSIDLYVDFELWSLIIFCFLLDNPEVLYLDRSITNYILYNQKHILINFLKTCPEYK